MKKRLPFFGLLLGLLLGTSSSLIAADFTISGKISLVQTSVPLPFYEVSIADGEGKYLATVKTSFSGRYSHTFDIPTNETVQFEVAVIDRCTGNSLIEAFEKEGTKVTANFLVCDPSIITGEEIEEEEENDEPNNEVLFANNNNNGNSNSIVIKEDKSILNKVKYFPNPATTSVTLQLQGLISEIMIIQSDGKVVRRFENVPAGEMQIDLTGFSEGFYLIRFRKENGVANGKLIVIKP